MIVLSALPRFRWTFLVWVLLLSSAPAAGARGLLVQEIGEVSSAIAQVFATEVVLVPFSARMDPRTTPILVAPGKGFVARNEDPVHGLRPSELRAIELAYEAGQPIVLLDANMHDISALHRLVGEGMEIESGAVVLAYAFRRENNIPSGRLVTNPVQHGLDDNRSGTERESDTLATIRALEIVVDELTRPPAPPVSPDSKKWVDNAVEEEIITSTVRGEYNTPVKVYALHSCAQNKDYYLVNAGGTWTPTQARWQSASKDEKTLWRIGNSVGYSWQDDRNGRNGRNCSGGDAVRKGFFGGEDSRACRYLDYPLFYEVDIVPPSGPTVIQVNAAPAGNQGKSGSYTSGFSFSIFGGVDVSSRGVGGGFQAGVTWDNSVSFNIPELLVEAGNMGNQGTFTRYKYCTIGTTGRDCEPRIQMTDEQGVCRNYIVGSPQNGQTPNGRLSNLAHTVSWQVDPSSYDADTFDIKVSFEARLASSESDLWFGFDNVPALPAGDCNPFGCSCGIKSKTFEMKPEPLIFHVPHPSTKCKP